MKIFKLIVVEFEKEFDLNNFQKKVQNTSIRYHSTYETPFGKSIIFSGEQGNLEYERIDNKIKISNEIINSICKDLEDTINIISLSKISGKKISSSQPSIFLQPETDSELSDLNNASKLALTNPVNIAQISVGQELDFEMCQNELEDRLDGVKIFSEALSSKSPSGKFREFIRLFERAFKRENRGLIKPLTSFLETAEKLEYNEDEIKDWIGVRHRLNHSNSKEGFLIDREIIHQIPRIEQAAYDILFNKNDWGNKSLLRRDLFKFQRRVNKNNQVVLKPESTENISLIMYDETRTFPVSYMARFDPSKIPSEWWYEGDGKYTFSNMIRIEK
jgi:hypothetical protein